jgi:hypothetical protein
MQRGYDARKSGMLLCSVCFRITGDTEVWSRLKQKSNLFIAPLLWMTATWVVKLPDLKPET